FVNYTKNLPVKIKKLQDSWNDIRQYPYWNEEKLKEFHREVHTLCGSSGTYGYKDLSQSARELEVYLRILIEKNSRDLKQDQKEEIECLLKKLDEKSTSHDLVEPNFLVDKNINKKEKKLIYLLDEDIDFVNETKIFFEQTDYHLKSFCHLQEFQQAIKEKKPEVIIMDIKYSDEERPKDIPLIFTSKNNDLLTHLKAVRSGCYAFVHKPNEINNLVKIVDQVAKPPTEGSYRVLIIDDSASLAEYYAFILNQAGMITATLSYPLQLLEKIEEFQPDLLLMDVYMPECTGVELATVLRQKPLYTSLPIVFLSSEEDRLKQLSALSVGGDDFLTKPVLPQHLVAAVRSRAKRADILSSYITQDSLTGLLNHTNILEHLSLELTSAQRKGVPLAFVMIDIDNFKSINDSYGHLMGDYVLKKLAQFLRTQFRNTDMVGRYGGEEFAVILPGIDTKTCIKLCDNIRKKFSEMRFTSDNAEFFVTFSAGVASYPQMRDVKQLVVAADQALYKSKRAGRNQVQS
ncbi:MAG: diguanylate cyclase, partial [Gammaproteobacteria bacterium]